MKTTVSEIKVFTKILDGGPKLCGSCVSAWRPCFTRCPSCGSVLNGEWNTPRAREIYVIQRRDEAPQICSPEWIPYLRSQGVQGLEDR